jgi:RNA polymerase-binding protein DksA
MTTIDLTEARKRLAAAREQIRDRIASEQSMLPSLDGVPTESHYASHAADIASQTYEEEKALSQLSHFEDELHAVEDALQRVEDGTYGTCAACGAEILAERLEALPAASLCVGCQSKLEVRR